MPLNNAVAQFGLVATVSGIVVVSTISPLLKQPSRLDDRDVPVAFAPRQDMPPNNLGPFAQMPADEKPKYLASAASTVGTSDSSSQAATSPEDLPSAALPPLNVVAMSRPSEESVSSAARSSLEPLRPTPIPASTETATVKERVKRRHNARVVRPASPPSPYGGQFTGQSAYRTASGRTDSIPFSYNKQFGAQ